MKWQILYMKLKFHMWVTEFHNNHEIYQFICKNLYVKTNHMLIWNCICEKKSQMKSSFHVMKFYMWTKFTHEIFISWYVKSSIMSHVEIYIAKSNNITLIWILICQTKKYEFYFLSMSNLCIHWVNYCHISLKKFNCLHSISNTVFSTHFLRTV